MKLVYMMVSSRWVEEGLTTYKLQHAPLNSLTELLSLLVYWDKL